MAKDVTHNPWVFDATTQAEGWANFGSRGTGNAVFRCKPFIDYILFETNGTDADFQVHDASSGNDLTGTVRVGSSNGQTQVAIGKYVDGVYITALATSGKIYVYHGQEA